MVRRLAALILLCTAYLIQTEEDHQPISLKVVELGKEVTLHCPVSKQDGQFFYWYKQPLGYMVQTVSTGTYTEQKLSTQFNNPRFKVADGKALYFLTIRNVSKEDEATYFCHNGTAYKQSFFNGIFLAVKDRNQQKVYVKQSPDTESVHPGDSVALQCSLLSKNKGNKDQCPLKQHVFWFRSGSGESHPSIIYTHSDEQEKRSCEYSLFKTIQNSSDTGTYYCAVATCGEILFGGGTKVETRSTMDPVVIVLGVLLACCVTVIVVLVFCINRRTDCLHCKGPTSVTSNPGQDKSTVDHSADLDGDGEALNYAALNFSTRKVNRVNKKRELSSECVYSAVRANHHPQLHPGRAEPNLHGASE